MESRSGVTRSEVTRKVNLVKTDCSWCWEPATWLLSDAFGADYACTAHGEEWYCEAFMPWPLRD